MLESLLYETEPATPSNVTDVAPVNPDPTTMTLVPPKAGPEVGESEVTSGTG